MAANTISGPHGRDITSAEAGSTAPAKNPPLDQLTFGDVLDAINPLQYVPVVGTIYRVCTGDQGSPGLRTAVSMVTGALTGGPVGLLVNMASAMVEQAFPFEQAARSMWVGSPKAVAAPPTHAMAEADLGRQPAASAPDSPPPGVARSAVAAYACGGPATQRLVWGGRER